MSKYEDLAVKISRHYGVSRTTVSATLRWLDEHPDQVPGRTITESELRNARSGFEYASLSRYVAMRFLEKLGITIVPDPEPTNAEKLMSDIERIKRRVVQPTSEELADELADLGWVKAPEAGGDDDQ